MADSPAPSNDILKFRPSSYDQELLEGPQSRWREFKMLNGVMWEFLRGFRALHFVGPCVTVFGSARFEEGHPYYELGRDVGRMCAQLGFTVMTGGGPGIMEAANRGAKEAGGRSVACNIQLPFEQKPNPYIDRFVTLKHFFTRKVMLFKYSYAFIVLPGGAGTMDEFFEAVTLMQTKKIINFPLIVMGKEYWRDLVELFEVMVRGGTIDASELNMLLVTDSVDEARGLLQDQALRAFQAHKYKMPRAVKWLMEYGHDYDAEVKKESFSMQGEE